MKLIDPATDYHAQEIRLQDLPAAAPRSILLVSVAIAICFVVAPSLLTTLFLPEGTDLANIGRTPVGLLLQLFGFGLPLLTLISMSRTQHKITLWALVGPAPLATAGFRQATGAVFVLLIALELLPPWVDASYIAEVRPVGPWLAMLPVAMAALFVQVLAEETFFRGYLQQQIAKRWQSPFFWMLLPSFVFGAVHYFNASGPAEGVIWALFGTLLALASADLTARHGSIGPAVGLHMMNNASAFLLYGQQGRPDSGLALILTPMEMPDAYAHGLDQLLQPWALFEMVIVALYVCVLWLAARIAIRR